MTILIIQNHASNLKDFTEKGSNICIYGKDQLLRPLRLFKNHAGNSKELKS